MIDLIYIERDALNHPRVQEICARFPKATIVECEHYGEVFNPKGQNFRLQKKRPALILALKHKGYVLPTPDGYGLGGASNFYFSHMMNCIYDCRYCFLQGMYRSAHYVVFVNFETFADAIVETVEKNEHPTWFFSGYDCDSLALEPVTGFVSSILKLFEALPNSWLELRTKSTQIRNLLAREPLDNVVVAYSFTPTEVSEVLENKVPALVKRLSSIQQLAKAGWKIGLRFDPVIFHRDYRQQYQSLFDQVFFQMPRDSVHSVTLGPFRMPKSFHKHITNLYPEEALFAQSMTESGGVLSYGESVEREVLGYCSEKLLNYIEPGQFYTNGYVG